jgi:hypothetical protein
MIGDPLDELQGSGIHAVAQAGGLRAVREDVAEMGVALAAEHFGAFHAKAAVGLLDDVLFGDGSPEAWPAGAGLKLGVGAEQRIAAADAAVDCSGVSWRCARRRPRRPWRQRSRARRPETSGGRWSFGLSC